MPEIIKMPEITKKEMKALVKAANSPASNSYKVQLLLMEQKMQGMWQSFEGYADEAQRRIKALEERLREVEGRLHVMTLR